MRLGFWNRLAVVSAILAVLLVPVLIMGSMENDTYTGAKAWREDCNKFAEAALKQSQYSVAGWRQYHAATAECWNQFNTSLKRTAWTWANWRELAQGTFQGCAIIYALIWAVAATVKWVWRGRAISAP